MYHVVDLKKAFAIPFVMKGYQLRAEHPQHFHIV